jgi:hypothetical protein
LKHSRFNVLVPSKIIKARVFLQDTLALDHINTLTVQLINFSDMGDVDLMSTLDQAELAMLDPVTLQKKTHAVSHGFHLTDLNLLETRKKLEVMENSHYTAKLTRTRSELQVIGVLKDNTQAMSLILEFSKHLQTLKKESKAPSSF